MPTPQRTKPKGKKPLLIFFPDEVVKELSALAKKEDTDRSKLIRKAVRNFIKAS